MKSSSSHKRPEHRWNKFRSIIKEENLEGLVLHQSLSMLISQKTPCSTSQDHSVFTDTSNSLVELKPYCIQPATRLSKQCPAKSELTLKSNNMSSTSIPIRRLQFSQWNAYMNLYFSLCNNFRVELTKVPLSTSAIKFSTSWNECNFSQLIYILKCLHSTNPFN